MLHELEEVIASPHFCNSKRYPALLRYIVENTLDGKSDLLKERTLGIEVFDRPATYDTNADTVVRYTAGEVRKRLLLFYSEGEHGSGIRISLPAGSYVPEFLVNHHENEGEEQSADGPVAAGSTPQHVPTSWEIGLNTRETPSQLGIDEASAQASFSKSSPFNGRHSSAAPGQDLSDSPPKAEADLSEFSREETQPAARKGTLSIGSRALWAIVIVAVLVLATAGLSLKHWVGSPDTAIDEFWEPVLRDQHAVTICTGGVVFKQENFSGVVTADKDVEYPFVSMQIASSIAQVSVLAPRFNATTQLVPSPTTPLTEIRERPVILLGGYNNRWAMRLLQSQRFYFTSEPLESISDHTQPQVHWSRDRSIPYANADDFGLVARFRDSTTGNWVVVLAGLGRNGTEAAAIFATDPKYMQQLEARLGQRIANRNVEAVLKVRVVDGKTGAPSMVAAGAW